MEPLDTLLAFGQILIPLAVAVPPLLVFTRAVPGTRDLIVTFWFVPLIYWAAILVEILWTHAPQPDFPGIVTCFVTTGTSGALMVAYIQLGKFLVDEYTGVTHQQEQTPLPDVTATD